MRKLLFAPLLAPLLLGVAIAQTNFYVDPSWDALKISITAGPVQVWSRCGHALDMILAPDFSSFSFNATMQTSRGRSSYFEYTATGSDLATIFSQINSCGSCFLHFTDDGSVYSTNALGDEVKVAVNVTGPGCNGNTDECAEEGLGTCHLEVMPNNTFQCIDLGPSETAMIPDGLSVLGADLFCDNGGYAWGCPPGEYIKQNFLAGIFECSPCAAVDVTRDQCVASGGGGRFYHTCTGLDGDSTRCGFCPSKPQVASWSFGCRFTCPPGSDTTATGCGLPAVFRDVFPPAENETLKVETLRLGYQSLTTTKKAYTNVYLEGQGFGCSAVVWLDGVVQPSWPCNDLPSGFCVTGQERCRQLRFELPLLHPLIG